MTSLSSLSTTTHDYGHMDFPSYQPQPYISSCHVALSPVPWLVVVWIPATFNSIHRKRGFVVIHSSLQLRFEAIGFVVHFVYAIGHVL